MVDLSQPPGPMIWLRLQGRGQLVANTYSKFTRHEASQAGSQKKAQKIWEQCLTREKHLWKLKWVAIQNISIHKSNLVPISTSGTAVVLDLCSTGLPSHSAVQFASQHFLYFFAGSLVLSGQLQQRRGRGLRPH